MSSDANTKSTWAALFSRKGASGVRTRLWDDWNDQTRAKVLQELVLDGGELPVLLARPPGGAQTVLTTRRLLCGSVNSMADEIVEIKPLQFGEKRKDQLHELSIGLSSGGNPRVASEPVPSFFALWCVLLHISKRNARKQPAS
jgi:hypothetical protein